MISFLGPPVGKILFFFPKYHTVDLLFNRNPFKRPKYISLLKSMFMITVRDSYQNYSTNSRLTKGNNQYRSHMSDS